jgi:tRNA dimethylallyltransferase
MHLIQLLGPTSSGKSDLAVDLVDKLKALGRKVVILSCDSRQVYKKLNLASGKVPGSVQVSEYYNGLKAFYYRNVEHYFIDIIDLNKVYTVTDYIEDYCELFKGLVYAGVDTIVMTGGSGMYARAVWEEYAISKINEEDKPEFQEIKTSLNSLILEDLQSQLVRQDFNDSDWANSRRLVNSILKNRFNNKDFKLVYPELKSKIKFVIDTKRHDPELEKIKDRIEARIDERLRVGMVDEVSLLAKEYGFERLYNLGLESRGIMEYVAGKLSYDEMQTQLNREVFQYCKRQLVWLSKEQDANYIVTVEEMLELIKDTSNLLPLTLTMDQK